MATESLNNNPQPTPSNSAPAPRKILRAFIVLAIALLGAFVFSARVNPAHMDYIEYWASGNLLTHFSNPYSPAAIFRLEKSHGFLSTSPLIMLNPPWALFLVAPLGFLTPRAGLILWILATGACIIFAVHLLNPRSKDNALALLFAPAIACIGSGQSSPFLLLGFALFLYFHRRRPFVAGASLLLMAIKPHLFLAFWPVLFLDCILRRRLIILAGGAAALISATAFSLCLDRHIWSHYFAAFRATPLHHQFFPTLSGAIRVLAGFQSSYWLLLTPSAVAIVWSLVYYARNRQAWDWTSHGMLLMLVTVLASPYGWFPDEIVLLPAIIFALNLPRKHAYAGWALLAINAVAALVYTAFEASLRSPFLIWTPAAWLLWFLYATRKPRPSDLATPSTNVGDKQYA